MSKALYRKYRSKSLSEVVGQDHITTVLAKSIEKGRVAHAYLLTGPRGVGKTSIARILAHEINQLPYAEDSTHLDIIEIDAASNNGVEDVRDLREKVQIAPVSAKQKVYIIDEVHMLSKPAFNALLKTLEEPPEHIVFILATTDADKLPPTIISRTQQFHFRAIDTSAATKHLEKIAKAEDIKIDPDALHLLAERGQGSFRDSISMLDQLSALAGDEPITASDVEQTLGLAPHALVNDLLKAYQKQDVAAIIKLLDTASASGVSGKLLAAQIISTVRKHILARPELVPLLDQLLDVEKSSRPEIKLLTVLARTSVRTSPPEPPKSAALAATSSAPAVAATPAELTEPPTPLTQTTKPIVRQKPVKKSAVTTTIAPEKVEHAAKDVQTTALDALDWPALVETVRTNFVAVYSMLTKCSHALVGGELVIYTGNAFYKKKLDDPKHRINLAKALESMGHTGVSIITIGTPPPPKDSTLAAVAAIMGGGEEINLDQPTEQPA